MFTHGERIVIHRATVTRNRLGQTTVTHTDEEPQELVAFAPESTQEPRDGTEIRVVSTAKLYLPPTIAPIGPADEVTVRGHRYGVEGDDTAEQWINPFSGWNPGSEVKLRSITDGAA